MGLHATVAYHTKRQLCLQFIVFNDSFYTLLIAFSRDLLCLLYHYLFCRIWHPPPPTHTHMAPDQPARHLAYSLYVSASRNDGLRSSSEISSLMVYNLLEITKLTPCLRSDSGIYFIYKRNNIIGGGIRAWGGEGGNNNLVSI